MKEKEVKTHTALSSKDVIAFYDRYAPDWDDRFHQKKSTREFHRRRLDSFLQIAHLEKANRIVEVGVGTGPYLKTISPLVHEIICIDGSYPMLEILKAKHGRLPNIRIFHWDLEELLSADSIEADLLYGFGIIEHVINLENFLGNCKRMLRPGGRIIWITPNGKSPWYHGIRCFWRGGSHCSTDRYYTLEQLKDLMDRYGFQVDGSRFWGFFPAGIGDRSFQILNRLGRILEKTFLQRYAGGLTVSFVSKK